MTVCHAQSGLLIAISSFSTLKGTFHFLAESAILVAQIDYCADHAMFTTSFSIFGLKFTPHMTKILGAYNLAAIWI